MQPNYGWDDVAEMEAAVERLRREIDQLKQERDALDQGNLELYRKLTTHDPDF